MRHAAFLRGINLGRRRVIGADLVAAFDSAGIAGSTAFQASGNVVFDDDRSAGVLEPVIEHALDASLGFEVRVILRSAAEIVAAASARPFTAVELRGRGKIQAILVHDRPSKSLSSRVADLAPDGELLRWSTGVLWWLPAHGVSDSQIDFRGLDAMLGLNTMRTKGTVERIADKFMAAQA